MKKGFLSILAASLLVVGCQDYDDQFSSLESQISALTQTVAGLAQVQSELGELSTTVANIQSALSDIPSAAEINTAVNDGLAGVVADIEDLETALDDVVSAEDLNTVSDALSDVANDVTDILSSNNVYSQKLTITNQAELDIAIGLGGKIALINNDVEIVLDEEMNRADLDSIATRITAVVGAFEYDGDIVDFESDGLVFDKLRSVSKKMVWETRDDISFPALTSVGSLEIITGESDLITSASFPVLTKLPYVSTSTDGGTTVQANTIDLEDSSSLVLTELVRYSGAATASQRGITGTDGTAITASNALTINLDDDVATTFDLAALTTEDATTATIDNALALTISGAQNVTLANYAKGVLIANDATTVVLPDYQWSSSTSLTSVETLRVHKVASSVDLTVGFSALEVLDLRNDAYTVTEPTEIAITISGNTNVEDVNLDGYFASFDGTGASSLDALVTAGELGDLTLTTTKLEELTLGHKAWRTLAGTPEATLKLTGNTKLTSVSADLLDDVNELSIIDNDKLATITMAALTSPSTAVAASVANKPTVAPVIGALIYGNAKMTSTVQAASAAGAITTVAESVTLDQLPASVITWIKAAKAVWGTTGFGAQGQASKADGTFYIETDEHATVTAAGVSTELSSAYTAANVYAAADSNGGAGTYSKRTLNLGSTDGNITAVTIGGADVPSANGTAQGTLGATVARFITESASLLADKGVTATSSVGGNPTGTVSFTSGTLRVGDMIKLSVGTINVTSDNGSATATPTYTFTATGSVAGNFIGDFGNAYTGNTSFTRLANEIEDRIDAGVASATAATAYTGTATSTAGASNQALESADTSDGIIEMNTRGVGSEFDNAAIVVTVLRKPAETTVASWTALTLWEQEAAADTVTATLANLGININGTASTADDIMEGDDVLLTLTSTKPGSLSTIGDPGDATTGSFTSMKIGTASITSAVAGGGLNVSEVGVRGSSTIADLKHSLGIGADIATAATAAQIKAANIAIGSIPSRLPLSSQVFFGLDPIANTADAAGTTPDKISKLAAGI
ncbi:hypothetical protein N9H57_03595, partial [Flavobacteriaceae bacterium]|nr:hypothetical protein [Flavobacteriaceae bacterium]